jgi:hypothetical protein
LLHWACWRLAATSAAKHRTMIAVLHGAVCLQETIIMNADDCLEYKFRVG